MSALPGAKRRRGAALLLAAFSLAAAAFGCASAHAFRVADAPTYAPTEPDSVAVY